MVFYATAVSKNHCFSIPKKFTVLIDGGFSLTFLVLAILFTLAVNGVELGVLNRAIKQLGTPATALFITLSFSLPIIISTLDIIAFFKIYLNKIEIIGDDLNQEL